MSDTAVEMAAKSSADTGAIYYEDATELADLSIRSSCSHARSFKPIRWLRCNFHTQWGGSLKYSNGDAADDLQVAADRTAADSLCGALVSLVFAFVL
jgi:hypothetical protein